MIRTLPTGTGTARRLHAHYRSLRFYRNLLPVAFGRRQKNQSLATVLKMMQQSDAPSSKSAEVVARISEPNLPTTDVVTAVSKSDIMSQPKVKYPILGVMEQKAKVKLLMQQKPFRLLEGELEGEPFRFTGFGRLGVSGSNQGDERANKRTKLECLQSSQWRGGVSLEDYGNYRLQQLLRWKAEQHRTVG